VSQSVHGLTCRWTDNCAGVIGMFSVLCHTHTQPFNGLKSGTIRVGRFQKKHSPTHTHPDHQKSFINFLHLLCSIVQFTCLTVLFDNLSPGPLWSSSWSWALYFILHAFLHPIIIFFSQHMPIPTQSSVCLLENGRTSEVVTKASNPRHGCRLFGVVILVTGGCV